jgi:hypothetical protein
VVHTVGNLYTNNNKLEVPVVGHSDRGRLVREDV